MSDIADWFVWVATAIGINVASMAIWKKMNQPKVYFILYNNRDLNHQSLQKNIKNIILRILLRNIKMNHMILQLHLIILRMNRIIIIIPQQIKNINISIILFLFFLCVYLFNQTLTEERKRKVKIEN